jgi:hypothetical protein
MALSRAGIAQDVGTETHALVADGDRGRRPCDDPTDLVSCLATKRAHGRQRRTATHGGSIILPAKNSARSSPIARDHQLNDTRTDYLGQGALRNTGAGERFARDRLSAMSAEVRRHVPLDSPAVFLKRIQKSGLMSKLHAQLGLVSLLEYDWRE